MAEAAAPVRISRGGGGQLAQVWKPHRYQLKAAKHLLANPGAALFLDPGLGKTSSTLAAIKALKDAGKLKHPVLIIAPLRVAHLVWPAEVAKWLNFADLTVVVLHGKDKELMLDSDADIFVINPEGLEWLFGHKTLKFSGLVIDESTKFKSWKAQRTKRLKAELNRFAFRWILTGTPAPNGIGDLFSQIFMIDGGRALGRYITNFRTTFMVQGGYGGYEWFPKEGALEEIEARLKKIVLRLDAADWLELPELTYNRIGVRLPASLMSKYRELEEEYLVALQSGEISALTAATVSMKLRQFVNGQVYDEDRKVHYVHDVKLDALESLVEELSGQPVLVAVAFLPEVDAIRERLGKNIPYLGGGNTPKESKRIVDEWNAGKLPIVLAHPTSVSHGLNLQGGRHVCWYGLTWNLEEYDQFIRRVWRQGQTQRVICHSIIALDTVDVKVEGALRSKQKVQSALLERLK